MRKLYRSIARARMRKAGLRRINRQTIVPVTLTHISGPVNLGSYFSRNWKTWCLAEAPMAGRRV